MKAKEKDMAGITVYRGIEGFGASSRIHSARIFRMSEDLPIILEIVDIPQRIEEFLSILEEYNLEGTLVTVEDINIVKYTYSNSKS